MTKKKNVLADLMGSLGKQFGKGAVMCLGDHEQESVKSVSTGSMRLDRALGIGGLPVGRVVEIYGPESSGKTTLALHAIAEVQKAGGFAAFVDAEHALDPKYAAALGVDLSQLLVSQPDCGEQALEITEAFARSGRVNLVIIDSVAALTPKAELDGAMGAPQMGLQARLMSQALRKLTAAANQQGTTIIFINQLRQKIGVVFGNPETTTGGNALKFYASVRLDVRRIATIKDGEQGAVGNRVRVKIVKNKVAPPFREAEFEIFYGRGICRAGELIEAGLEDGCIEKNGAWFSFGEERLGQGRERVRERLLVDPELRKRVEDTIGLSTTKGTKPDNKV
jgi:recombination protein RecA